MLPSHFKCDTRRMSSLHEDLYERYSQFLIFMKIKAFYFTYNIIKSLLSLVRESNLLGLISKMSKWFPHSSEMYIMLLEVYIILLEVYNILLEMYIILLEVYVY